MAQKSALENRHPQYQRMHALVQYYRDHYEGGPLYPSKNNPLPSAQAATSPASSPKNADDGSGRRYGAKNYLWQYPLERSEKYVHRLARAVYVNIVGPVVDFYCSTVGKPENAVITRKGADFDEFLENADGQGQALEPVLATARTNAAVAGHTFLFIDTPAAEDGMEPVTKLDEQRAGIRPYVTEILREDMLNWRLDRQGQPLEILYRVRCEAPGSVMDPEAGKADQSVEYRYWSRTEWSVWAEGKEGFEQVGGGVNRLGIIPVVCWYHRRKGAWDGEGLLKDSAKYAQLLTNWVSGFDESLESNMFPIPVWKSRKSPTDEGVGTSTMLHLNPEEGEEFFYVTPETGPFEAGWKAFALMVALANKHMGISPKPLKAEGSGNDPQSGLSKEWDFVETEKVLVTMARSEQDAVVAMLRIVGQYLSVEWTGTVQYASKFDLSTAAQNIENLISLQSAGAPPVVQQNLMQLAVSKILTSLPDAVEKAIRKAIEQVEGPPAMTAPGGPDGEGPDDEAEAEKKPAAAAEKKPGKKAAAA